MPALLLWGLGFFITDPMFRGVCLVMTATPVGSMTVMLAQLYFAYFLLIFSIKCFLSLQTCKRYAILAKEC